MRFEIGNTRDWLPRKNKDVRSTSIVVLQWAVCNDEHADASGIR